MDDRLVRKFGGGRLSLQICGRLAPKLVGGWMLDMLDSPIYLPLIEISTNCDKPRPLSLYQMFRSSLVRAWMTS